MRNVAEYEGTLDVGERIVTDLVAACETVGATLAEMIAGDER